MSMPTFALSQACTMAATFDADIVGYSDGGCTQLEVWLTKLEQHLKTNTLEATRALLAERGTTLVAAAYQGGLLLSQGDARKASFDHFRTRLELCQAFAIPVLCLVADFAQKPDELSLERAVVSLKQAGQWAAGYGVSLALEFRAGDTFCTCLQTALLLIEQCDEPNVGVCLDAFHYTKGPSKPEDLAYLSRANLLHVQLSDVAGVPRELMTDSDRVFPGEGDFELRPLLSALQAIDYTGAISLELFNPSIWDSKPSQVAQLGMMALARAWEPYQTQVRL